MMKNRSWCCAGLHQNSSYIALTLSLVSPSRPQRKSKITASRKLMLKVRLVPWEMEGQPYRLKGGRKGKEGDRARVREEAYPLPELTGDE